jgi:hypothetical protein
VEGDENRRQVSAGCQCGWRETPWCGRSTCLVPTGFLAPCDRGRYSPDATTWHRGSNQLEVALFELGGITHGRSSMSRGHHRLALCISSPAIPETDPCFPGGENGRGAEALIRDRDRPHARKQRRHEMGRDMARSHLDEECRFELALARQRDAGVPDDADADREGLNAGSGGLAPIRRPPRPRHQQGRAVRRPSGASRPYSPSGSVRRR